MAAKNLGQIHTCNYSLGPITSDSDKFLLDLPQELSSQLNRMIRQSHYFKVVGIDMNVTDASIGDAGGQITGWLKYYAPTKGRCRAWNNAFKAMKTAMKLQGISTTANTQYDFRTVLQPLAEFNNGTDIKNVASLTGSNELVLSSPDSGTPENTKVFDVYNAGVKPQQFQDATIDFTSGFNTMGVQSSPTDFVRQDAKMWSGNPNAADEQFEKIPFQLSYTPGSTDVAFTLEWRPDPALYVAVMTGQFVVEIDEIDLDTGTDDLNLEVSIMVAGWKSILPTRRKSRRRRKKRKSRR